jgi:hypothetical protein
VAHRPSAGVELGLELRTEGARLHAGQARHVVDREHLVHPAEVDRDDRSRLIGRRLEASRDVRAAAERDHDGVGVDRGPDDRGHLVLAPGIDDDVGNPPDVAGAVADEVAQAFPARMDHAIERVERDVRGADRLLELGAQAGRRGRLGDVEVVEGDGPGLRPVDVDADGVLEEGRQGGLVLVREGDLVVAPAPPLRLTHRSVPRLVVHGRQPRIGDAAPRRGSTTSVPAGSRRGNRSRSSR